MKNLVNLVRSGTNALVATTAMFIGYNNSQAQAPSSEIIYPQEKRVDEVKDELEKRFGDAIDVDAVPDKLIQQELEKQLRQRQNAEDFNDLPPPPLPPEDSLGKPQPLEILPAPLPEPLPVPLPVPLSHPTDNPITPVKPKSSGPGSVTLSYGPSDEPASLIDPPQTRRPTLGGTQFGPNRDIRVIDYASDILSANDGINPHIPFGFNSHNGFLDQLVIDDRFNVELIDFANNPKTVNNSLPFSFNGDAVIIDPITAKQIFEIGRADPKTVYLYGDGNIHPEAKGAYFSIASFNGGDYLKISFGNPKGDSPLIRLLEGNPVINMDDNDTFMAQTLNSGHISLINKTNDSEIPLAVTWGFYNILPGKRLLKYKASENLQNGKEFPYQELMTGEPIPGVKIQGTDGVVMRVISYGPEGDLLPCQYFTDVNSNIAKARNHDFSNGKVYTTTDNNNPDVQYKFSAQMGFVRQQ